MEDSEKKPKAKPVAKSAAAKTTQPKASVTAKTPKAAAAPKAPKAEAEVAPAAKKASTKKAAPAPAAEAPVAAKKASTKKAAAAVTADAPAVKKAATKKAAAVEATAEKPAAKKSSANKIAEEAAPAAKKSAAKKVAAEAVPAKTKKAASKSAEAAPTIAKAEEAAAPKKERKSKSAAKATEAPAQEAPTAEGEGKKQRSKPRRRELKRQGLWVPKEQRGKHGKQMAALKADATTEKPKITPAKDVPVAKAKKQDAPSAKATHKEGESKFSKFEVKGGKKGNEKPAKGVPEEFQAFTKRPNTRTERKNERRMERLQKEERDLDQSQGLFVEPIRLNRFVALSGICSRRDADLLIQEGKVKVNGKVVKEMGHKVMPGKDKVIYKDNELKIKVFVYLLMNKPKNRITTTEDDLGRDTVMDIAERYTKARVYPVGRLDRNTTGLLILTNDGDLTLKLTHPSSKFSKYYQVRLDRDISDADILSLRKGFELEDGFIKADKVERVDSEAGNEIGIEIHSGANHIVKRMMAHLGYEVTTLDRVKLGPLTKKGLPRGNCRFLTEREVGFLKML